MQKAGFGICRKFRATQNNRRACRRCKNGTWRAAIGGYPILGACPAIGADQSQRQRIDMKLLAGVARHDIKTKPQIGRICNFSEHSGQRRDVIDQHVLHRLIFMTGAITNGGNRIRRQMRSENQSGLRKRIWLYLVDPTLKGRKWPAPPHCCGAFRLQDRLQSFGDVHQCDSS